MGWVDKKRAGRGGAKGRRVGVGREEANKDGTPKQANGHPVSVHGHGRDGVGCATATTPSCSAGNSCDNGTAKATAVTAAATAAAAPAGVTAAATAVAAAVAGSSYGRGERGGVAYPPFL